MAARAGETGGAVIAARARSTGDAEGAALTVGAEMAAEAAAHAVATVRWPPAADPGDLLAGLVAGDGSTILVVPEGRLGGLAARLRAASATVVPWLTEGRPRDRARAWERARRGQCVVLGGRSAGLAPVPDLAAVVVVDDGSEALKEERSPTWHARDLAAERVRRRGARLTVISPVPPLEAPGPLLVPSRTEERAGWPIIEVIDRRREPPGLGLFSERAVAALRAAVAAPPITNPERDTHRNGGQSARTPPGGAQRSVVPAGESGAGGAERSVAPAGQSGAGGADRAAGESGSGGAAAGVRAICVLNRKGRARLLACGACGELARCERCEAAVAEGDSGADGVSLLACATCGATRPRVCVRCDSTKLKVLRSGVTRLREDLAALLPGVGVAMVDAATGELPAEPVLIGTEAVLHRVAPHLAGGSTAVVVFLDFDAELLAPRFRAAEQALWLVVRAARLVGPRAAGGRILVQTRLPRHEALEAAVRADPGVLADAERPRRKLLDLPPYAALARLTGDPPALAAAAAALRAAAPAIGVSGSGAGASGRTGASPGGGGAGTGARPSGDAVLVRASTAEALADALAHALAAGRPAGKIRAEVDPLRV
jgi:primosomal protein N' (replication factor Y)